MAQLIVEHDGKRTSFDGSKPVVIGRDADCDVVCTNPAVSRRHLEVTLTDGRWTVTDRSTLGTFAGTERITMRPVDRPLTLQLGDAAAGETIRILVDDPFARPQAIDMGTVMVPGGFEVSIDKVTARHEGAVATARAGEVLRIGRDTSNDLVVADGIVSRHHCRLTQRGDRWVLEDTNSSRGVFHNGAKVPTVDIKGKVSVQLGDPDGPTVTVEVGEAPAKAGRAAPSKRTKIIAGAVAGALLLLFGIWFFALRDPGGPGLDTARKASVWLAIPPNDGAPDDLGTVVGSGTLVSGDGLILTSAHVVAKDAAGVASTDPTVDERDRPNVEKYHERANQVVVWMYVDRTNMEARYHAEVVAADGYLDLAVLKINETLDGAAIQEGELHLPHVPLGDSDEVEQGAQLTVMGVDPPPDAQNPTLTVARETINQLIPDVLGLVDQSPAWFVGQAGQVEGGFSGGGLFDDDGRVVGVTESIRASNSSSTGQTVKYRPSNFAEEMVDLAKKGEQDQYPPYKYVKQSGQGLRTDFLGFSDSNSCTKPSKGPLNIKQGVQFVCLAYRNAAPGVALYASVTTGDGDDPVGGGWHLFSDTDELSGVIPVQVRVPPRRLRKRDMKAVVVRAEAGGDFSSLVKAMQPQLVPVTNR